MVQETHYGVWGEVLKGIGLTGDWDYLYQGKEYVDAFGYNNYDFHSRSYDPYSGRFNQIDGADQFASGYTGMGNNPVNGIDPDGQVFFIIPQIGWSKKGGLNIGLEVGVGVPGALSASITGGYNFGSKSGNWSVQGYASGFYAGYGSQGGFAGWGYRYAGFSAGLSYGREGWGAGLSYGGTTKNNFNGTVGIGWSQKGGFDFSVGAGYTKIIEKPTITKIAEYNLKGAPTEPMEQKSGFDCLVCAATYIDQMGLGRSYEEIMSEFGSLYDAEKGTSTQAALGKIYGNENIEAYGNLNPRYVGKQLEMGNPAILAENRNHALVLTKVEVITKSYRFNAPKSGMRLTYMNPAVGRFRTPGFIRSFNNPVFIIKFKK